MKCRSAPTVCSAGSSTPLGHHLATPDNTLDIEASGATRPRTIYAGTSVVTPAITVSGTATVGRLTSGNVVEVLAGAPLDLQGDSVNLRANAASGYTRFYAGGGVLRWFVEYTGHFLTGLDSTYDIGTMSGPLRPRNIHLGGGVGFYGTAAPTKQTVSGSRGGNAALASLLTGLAAYGLVTDSSTA